MSRCAASSVPTTSVTQKLARHGDILHKNPGYYVIIWLIYSNSDISLIHLESWRRIRIEKIIPV